MISCKGVSKKFFKNTKFAMRGSLIDFGLSLLFLKQASETLGHGEFWAFENVGFELEKGKSLWIQGPNGAGKTTLLRILAGIIPADKGNIISIAKSPCVLSIDSGFLPHLKIEQNLMFLQKLTGLRIDFEKAIAFADLERKRDVTIGMFSTGMIARLSIAALLFSDCDLLLLDEIVSVCDKDFKKKLKKEIESKSKTTIYVGHEHFFDPDDIYVLGSKEKIQACR